MMTFHLTPIQQCRYSTSFHSFW